MINKVVIYHFNIQKSHTYIRVKNLINNFNIIYNKRNFHVKNYIKLTIDNFKQFQTKIFINYIDYFNIILVYYYIIDKFSFDKQLNQRLFNYFINSFEQQTLNDLINIIRNR